VNYEYDAVGFDQVNDLQISSGGCLPADQNLVVVNPARIRPGSGIHHFLGLARMDAVELALSDVPLNPSESERH